MDSFIWPSVIAIISIGAILVLRPALLRLIDRTIKVSKNGLTFEHPQGGISIPKPILLSFDEIMKHPISASVLDRERNIKTVLQGFDLKSDTEKIDVIIRALANSRLEVEFNSIAYIIYGSQINLLNKLVGSSQGINLNDVKAIFIQAQTDYPFFHTSRTFDEWLNYLLAYNLITQTEEKIDITQYGSDFLKHLIDTRQVYKRFG